MVPARLKLSHQLYVGLFFVLSLCVSHRRSLTSLLLHEEPDPQAQQCESNNASRYNASYSTTAQTLLRFGLVYRRSGLGLGLGLGH